MIDNTSRAFILYLRKHLLLVFVILKLCSDDAMFFSYADFQFSQKSVLFFWERLFLKMLSGGTSNVMFDYLAKVSDEPSDRDETYVCQASHEIMCHVIFHSLKLLIGILCNWESLCDTRLCRLSTPFRCKRGFKRDVRLVGEGLSCVLWQERNSVCQASHIISHSLKLFLK